MKILVASLYFYPDHSGIALYSSDFAFYAAERGHSVEVITGYSFYPKWKKRKEDKCRYFSVEKYKGLRILRGYLYVPNKPTTLTRVVQEITFLFFGIINFFRAKKPDVVIAFTTPISVGFISGIYAKIMGCKLVINVQDFQLEAASSLGMANKGFFYRILSGLEKNSYKNAYIVSSISKSMYDLLLYKKCLPSTKAYLWPNWIELDQYRLNHSRKGFFRKSHNIPENKKIIAYAGNIGLKQGLEIFIDLADAFKDHPKLEFMIIGEGAAWTSLQRYAANKKVDNISFLPLLNKEQYLDFLNDLDIFFLSQKKTDYDVYFPSKLLGLMITKKILLLSADKNSELYRTILEKKIGLVAEYGNIDELIRLLKLILNDGIITENICNNAELYASQFSRETVLDNVLEKIKSL